MQQVPATTTRGPTPGRAPRDPAGGDPSTRGRARSRTARPVARAPAIAYLPPSASVPCDAGSANVAPSCASSQRLRSSPPP